MTTRSLNRSRIAVLLATSGHSGVDRVAAKLLPAMAGRGFQVDLLRVGGHGPYLDARENLRIVELSARHVMSAVPAIVRYLRRERPAVLFSDKDRVNRTALLACRLSRVSCRQALRIGTTVSINLTHRKKLDAALQRLSMKYLYPLADALLFPSQGAADDFAEVTGTDLGLIKVVPSPVVDERLYAAAREPLEHPWFAPGEPPVILGVGELGGRKDFETLIRAFAHLRAPGEARLVILGRGKRRDKLLALARQLDVAGDVDLPGFDPNPYRYMARAAVFALTSRWEGMPVVLIEALALGVPSVSTDCPSGPREILADGRYGRLVPMADSAALARALEETLNHPPDRGLLREAGRAYEVEASTDAYLAAMGLEPHP
ncbi:MAG: glycosyltransferase [Pseudomonadota bacterium]